MLLISHAESRWGSRCLSILSLFVVVAVTIVFPAAAQDSTVIEKLQPALEQARQDGATVVVISPNEGPETEATADGTDAQSSMQGQLIAVRNELGRIMGRIPRFPAAMADALAGGRENGSMGWVLYAIGLALVSIVVGRVFGMLLDNWGKGHFAHWYRPDPETRLEKLTYILLRSLLMVAIVAVFFSVAAAVVYAVAADDEVVRVTALIIIATVAIVRLVRIISMNLLVPDAAGHRLLAFDDGTAADISRRLTQVFIVSGTFLALCNWMDFLGMDLDAHKLSLVCALLITAVLLAMVALRYRAEVAHALRGGRSPGNTPVIARLIARFWHVIAVVYFAAAWGISTVRIVLDLESAFGLVVGPLLIVIACLTLYAIALLIIDIYLGERFRAPETLVFAPAGDQVGQQPAGQLGGNGGSEVVDGATVAPVQAQTVFKPLIEHAAGLVVVLLGATALLQLWGADLFDETSPFVRILDIGIILFLSYVAYQAVQIWVDSKRAEEGDIDSDAPGGDPGGEGASRLATLLPIFRNFLLITIVVIGGMIVLSELGVDIAPLFAGAGVVGLAIGFGAQTLIRDIFSGAFFLMDDAFRKGEYIDIGSAKGTVEKISIRSFQLRHHRGALNTVPFGEIKQLTNYSRDWVMMKLPIRLTYDTDIEKVRKLVKKLGQELLEDPEIGDKFLQPLKSQGVAQMEDSAMIVRLKFMTRPGDQFSIRTKIFTRVRELFEREGIKFAHREVTVRVNEGSDGPVSKEAKQAAAAATALPSPASPAQEPSTN